MKKLTTRQLRSIIKEVIEPFLPDDINKLIKAREEITKIMMNKKYSDLSLELSDAQQSIGLAIQKYNKLN